MNNSDTTAFRTEDLWVALGLLTRLPLPDRTWDETRKPARAAWAYPLVGAVIALLAGCLGFILDAAGLPAGFTAAAVLLGFTLLTGALHEDGLADAADGLWGGTTVERRLEIMKDSRIGAYGVTALIAGFALRWSALAALISAGSLWAPLFVVAIGSRAGMVFVMAQTPNAREQGLSHMTGRVSFVALCTAIATGSLLALIGFGFAGLLVIIAAALAAWGCKAIAMHKIGGQTGDILGASQQVTEIVIFAVLCAVVI